MGVTCNFVQRDFFKKKFRLSFMLLAVGFNSVGLSTDFFFLKMSRITFEFDKILAPIFEWPKSTALGAL